MFFLLNNKLFFSVCIVTIIVVIELIEITFEIASSFFNYRIFLEKEINGINLSSPELNDHMCS